MGELKVKRVYLPADEQDGYRVLIDRLWPRGLSKDKADIDEWDKQLAPSTELRKWFGHQPELFPAFTEKYIGELEHNDEAQSFVDKCKTLLSQGNVTLLFGAKDETHNQAVVLKKWMETKL